MVVSMMKWRPWLQPLVKRFQVKLKVHSLEGLRKLLAGKSGELGIQSTLIKSGELGKVMIRVKWRGPKSSFGTRFRSLKRAKTTEKFLEDSAIVNWEEEFEHTCTLTVSKDGQFLPWEVHFVIMQVEAKSKLVVLGSAVMNLSDFIGTSSTECQNTKLRILSPEMEAVLVVSLRCTELRTRESSGFDCFGPLLCTVDDQQLAGETDRKSLVNGKESFRDLAITQSEQQTPKSEQSSADSRESFGSDYFDDWEEEEVSDEEAHHFQCYGPLAGMNLVVEGALSHCPEKRHIKDHELYAPNKAVMEAVPKAGEQSILSEAEQNALQSSMRSILSWRKRKLSFRSPRGKSEPLLNKEYGEDGGDDIDFDRRLSGSPNDPLAALCQASDGGSPSPKLSSGCVLDFGQEDFAVGSWERQDLISRDGHLKLSADIFFATIDQRSERAAGESACTALVAVIADWLHQNPTRIPIKAEFDTLIREGSAEWRKLCDNQCYKDRFPDKHFDLDTVLQAKIRPLVAAPERSFVGFFRPETTGDSCGFLQGSMSFDDIWEEVAHLNLDGTFEPAVYIVSWNDHFFVLKVEKEECYLIDTLGARLYEGCNQAYILHFSTKTTLCHVPKAEEVNEEEVSLESTSPSSQNASLSKPDVTINLAPSLQAQGVDTSTTLGDVKTDQAGPNQQSENTTVYTGKDACREFIKGFFAALPLRELEIDMKKGLLGSIPLHHRLQVEFHYTMFGDILSEHPAE